VRIIRRLLLVAGLKGGEDRAGVPLEDGGALVVAQPADRLDDGPQVVEVAAGVGVERRADAGRLRAEEAPVGPDDAQEVLERLGAVEDGVEPQAAQVLVERAGLALDALCAPATDLVRDRAAAVAHDQA